MSSLSVRVVDDLPGFASLETAWSALAERSRHASVFASWEWQFLWWKHYGADAPLRVLVAEREGRLVGVLPLYIGTLRTMRVVPLRALRLVGTGGDTSPDDLDPPLDPEYGEAAARAFVDAVARLSGWDILLLSDLDEASPLLAAASGKGREYGWKLSPRVSARISWLKLPAAWEDYLGALSHDRRSKIRYDRRRIGAQTQSRFFVCDGAAELDRIYDALAELHRARWQGRADRFAFSSDRYIAFHREVVHACHRRGWLRLYCLEVEARLVAVLYCYAFRGATFYFQGGFDPALGKLRPGKALTAYAIEQAIGEGQHAFDMLRGEYEYKTQWAPEIRATHGVEIDRPGLVGVARRFARDYMPGIRRGLAALVGRAPRHDAHAGTP